MNVLSSPSAFLLNNKAHGLFSSQSAFKKPTLTKNSQQDSGLFPSTHPKDLAKNQYKPVEILSAEEGSDLVICEPLKKTKMAQDHPNVPNMLDTYRIQKTNVKSSKLTVDEVFNTPFESKKAQKGGMMDDNVDECSSLSFISSYSSFDNLDEVVPVEDGKTIECNDQNTITQPLVLKDNVASRLTYLSQENLFPSALYTPYPGFLSTINFNDYVQMDIDNQNLLANLLRSVSEGKETDNNQLNYSLVNKAKLGLSDEEGYDSDSYATRSTMSKSQKGASPLYIPSDYMYEEEKLQAKRSQGEKKMTSRKQGKGENKNKEKGKKGKSSLNLHIDINPKHLKVERRLNKLQMLRYQQGTAEGDDESVRNLALPDFLSRNTSVMQESSTECLSATSEPQMITLEVPQLPVNTSVPANTQATIPSFRLDGMRRQKPSLVPVWNPENVQTQEFEEYFQRLAVIMEGPVTNQEAALKLLKTFGMNVPLTLETVKENQGLYKELFRVKVKRLRRRGI